MFNKTDSSNCTLSFLCKELHMKKWLLGFVVILMLALAIVVFAMGPENDMGGSALGGPGFTGPVLFGPRPEMHGMLHGKPGPHPHEGIGPFKDLGLTKEQVKQLKAINDRTFQETRNLRYELSIKHIEMQKLFSDPRADEAKLLAKQKELSAFRQRLMDTMDQKLIEGRKLLTPDQIQELDRMAPPPEIGH